MIVDAVNKDQRLLFVTHTLTESMERQLDFVIAVILKRYGHEHLQSTLYSCLKEIVVNATKANAKEAYFREQNLDISNEDDYRRGMADLKGAMTEEWIEEYGTRARDMGLDVTVRYYHNGDGMRIEVFSTQMKAAEDRRIREKLSQGMQYDDLVAFYMANADQTEGEGIGLVMILLLLKAEHINPHLFRIGVVDGQTLSRLEVPFNGQFVSVRGADPAGYRR